MEGDGSDVGRRTQAPPSAFLAFITSITSITYITLITLITFITSITHTSTAFPQNPSARLSGARYG